MSPDLAAQRRRPARPASPRHAARAAQRLGRGQRQGAGRGCARAGHHQRGRGPGARLRDGGHIPAAEAFAALARIVAAVDVPVTADCEAGYGLDPRAFVDGLLGAGAVGCNLEDTDHATRGLRDPGEQAAFLAAVKAAPAAPRGVDLVLNARVDVHVRGGTLEDGLVRARAYREAGADCVYPIFCHDEEGIAAYVEAVAVVNVAVHPSAPDLARHGRARRRARELRRRRCSTWR